MQVNDKTKLIGVILCGGHSRRMGQDKAVLHLNNQSLIERQQQVLTQIVSPIPLSDIFLSGDRDGENVIPDLIPNQGPLGAIHSVLSYFLAKEAGIECYIVIVPVDMPAIRVTDLENLSSLINKEALAIRFSESELPLIIKINPFVENCARRLLASRKRSVHEFLDELERCRPGCIKSFSIENTFFLKNINTPSEWQDFLKEVGNEY